MKKIEEPYVIPPIDGWEENTWYKVRVSMNKSNPVFSALFFSGFLNGPSRGTDTQGPGGYNQVHSHTRDTSDGTIKIQDVYYLEVLHKLWTVPLHDPVEMPDRAIEMYESRRQGVRKVAVAYVDAEGCSDFHFYKIRCTDAEYEDGVHIRKAKELACLISDGDVVVYDETSPARQVLDMFVWESINEDGIHAL